MASPTPKTSKRELTREKVILAAIDCIYEEGFAAAHTNRIAEAAGVSWGVLQYHFGDKDGLLQAVIEYIFERFKSTLTEESGQEDSLEQRMRHLIDVIWSVVNKPDYRVSIAILRNAGKDPGSSIDGEQQLRIWSMTTSRYWDELFAPDRLDRQKSDTARHLLFATLRGLADEINPAENTDPAAIELELDALASAMLFTLGKR